MLRKRVAALLLLGYLLLPSGCGKKTDPFNGNVYFHDADSLAFIAGFDKDTLYYIINKNKAL